MKDRHEIRNAANGIVLILIAIVVSPDLYCLVKNLRVNLNQELSILINIGGLLSTLVLGRLIALISINVLHQSNQHYVDKARIELSAKIIEELHDNKIELSQLVKNKYYDSVFVSEYYVEASSEFIEWVRRKRDGQFFCSNSICSILIGLLVGLIYQFRSIGYSGVNLYVLLILIFMIGMLIWAYIIHKKAADIAELIWTYKYLIKKKNSTKKGNKEARV